MACSGRYNDGTGGDVCSFFDANANSKACGVTTDSKDVCVCRAPAPSAPAACASVELTSNDVVCGGECDIDGQCTCAAMFNDITHFGSTCNDVCNSFDMDCVGRNGDGGRSFNRACEWYYTGLQSKSCSVAGDTDDVCSCRARVTPTALIGTGSVGNEAPAIPPATQAPVTAATPPPTFSAPTTGAPTLSACSGVPMSSTATSGPWADVVCREACSVGTWSLPGVLYRSDSSGFSSAT